VSESEGLAIVSKKAPDAVICLLSALQFHGLTTQLPYQVWIMIPAGGHVPQLDYPPIKTVRAAGDAYFEGIETHKIDGVSVRVYNLHKTIADCFKHRNKIGLDVAMEALRDAWAQRKLKMDTLTHYARINRVEKAMRPYLEMLVS
jgi:predicted transcriptional regulator of viral defense system